jgi:hypothetical protein
MGFSIAIDGWPGAGFPGRRISLQFVPGKRFQASIRVRAEKAQRDAPPIERRRVALLTFR